MIRIVLAALTAAALASPTLAIEPQAMPGRDTLAWTFDAAHGEAVLRVVNERGVQHEFELGARLQWSPRGFGLADGSYRYELSIAPPGAPSDRRHAPESRARPGGALASGHFALRGGALAVPVAEAATTKGRAAAVHAKDQVIAENLIAQAGTAIGLDAVENASFGTLAWFLAENNLRIHFEDTSVGMEPSSDWELTANDSAQFGLSAFTIQQRTTARQVVRLLAGAPGGSFWIDGQGQLGLDTAIAQQRLHIASGDDVGVRLAQDNTVGFTPSTWDLVVDETGLRVSDALTGSTPFHVAPAAPTGTMTLTASRRVGIGTPEPQATLHVRRSDGSTAVRVEETDVAAAPRVLAQLRNSGIPRLLLQGENAGWTLRGDAAFAIATTAPAGGAMQLAANGDLALSGTLSQGSSRALKHAIEAAAPVELLDKVRALPIYAWRYTDDALRARHLGPMAEDVHAAFGFGGSKRSLAPGDVAALAVGAAQALREELAAADAELDALLVRLDRLEAASAMHVGRAP